MQRSQNDLLEEGHRLDELHRSYDNDAALNQPFVIQTIGSSVIATLGLVADNAVVVIGAMVVAPWILPLRTAVFAVLASDWRLMRQSLVTLASGAAICLSLSFILGQIAAYRGLLVSEAFQSEIVGRLSPSVLDLGIAIVAGAIATYAKVRPDAVSAMAGTAIAVALVPPVCTSGLTLASYDWSNTLGAGLLFTTNFLGILMGGIAVLGIREPYLRQKLFRNRQSKFALSIALLLIIGILTPLYEGSRRQRNILQAQQIKDKTDQIQRDVEQLIADFLTRKTLTFNANLAGVSLDLNGQSATRVIDVSVYTAEPGIPSFEQVEQVQALINQRIGQVLNVNFQLRVQRIPITMVSGSEQFDNLHLETEQTNLEERLKALEKQLQTLREIPVDASRIQPEQSPERSTSIPSAKENGNPLAPNNDATEGYQLLRPEQIQDSTEN